MLYCFFVAKGVGPGKPFCFIFGRRGVDFMKYLKIVSFHILLLLPIIARAQAEGNIWEPAPFTTYSFIHGDANTIEAHNKLDSFYHKLQAIKATRKGKVSIVHIGDSHLQADGITSVVRNGFQQFFGDAGRGLVFPYQLAGSNAPHDVKSSSNVSWKSNRLTSPDKPITTGISGYGIHSAAKNAFVNLQLKETDGKQDSFNRLVFFLGNDSVSYMLGDSGLASPIPVVTHRHTVGATVAVNTSFMLKGFELGKASAPEPCDFSFYGVSLERKDNAGVLYHTIGVNGARYSQFLQSGLFWEQLKALEGDLFIVSLGTNEAQNQFVNEQEFIAICDSFVKRVEAIAPKAAVIITTPAGSYYKIKKPNKSIQTVSAAINKYCSKSGNPCWDLFKISSGFEGTAAWKKYNLISHDGVHYNNLGYQLQGSLLLGAFASGYNNYIKSHPYKAPAKVVAPPRTSDIIVKPDIVKKEQEKKMVAPAPPAKPAPEARPEPKKAEPQNTEVVGPQKRKSNIVVEYSD